MKPIDCELESEVLAAVRQNRWPERVDSSLRTHVANCESCADLVVIAGTMDDAREELRACAVLPDSGQVWWRAQMRARREAVQAAGRPITAAQVLALACAMGLLGACFGATSAWFQYALRRASAGLAAVRYSDLIPLAAGFVAAHGALVLGMATIVVAIPAVVYFTMLRE